MTRRFQNSKVVSNKRVAENTYLFEFEHDSKKAIPGQFVHIKVPNRNDLLLRRPISVNSYDAKNNIIKLIIQTKGEGTQVICSLKTGDTIDYISPAGRGFLLGNKIKKAAVIGGGIGVAPLKYVMEYYNDIEFDSYIGFRNEKLIYQLDDFEKLTSNLYVCTDDGSYGEEGFVTDILDNNIKNKNYDIILACGPKPMLNSLKTVIDRHKIPCLVSLEERMGCGIGICKVCVCKTHENNEDDYKRVCIDGPVFDINKVVL